MEFEDFMWYFIFGLVAISGFVSFLQPEEYPIRYIPPQYTSIVGLIVFLIGVCLLLFYKRLFI